jgi:hypothetical protein
MQFTHPPDSDGNTQVMTRDEVRMGFQQHATDISNMLKDLKLRKSGQWHKVSAFHCVVQA